MTDVWLTDASETNATQQMLVGGFGFLNPNERSDESYPCLLIFIVPLATIYRYHLTGALILLSAPPWAVLTSL